MSYTFKVQFLVFSEDIGGTIVSTNSLYDILTKYRGELEFKTNHIYDSHTVIDKSVVILGVIQRSYNV